MKFNWGTGIAIFLIIFMSTLIFVVIKTFSIDNALVRDDYYTEDINYQKKYNKISNNGQVPITYEKASKSISLDFSKYPSATGEIHFYRPSDSSLDFRKKISLDNGYQVQSTSQMTPGLWRVKIDFSANGKGYFVKKDLYL